MNTSERVQVLLILAGLTAIALLFVPFAYDYVPLRNAFFPNFLDPTWRDVWPCLLLPWLVTGGHLAMLAFGRLPRTATLAFLTAAVISLLPFIYLLVALEWPPDPNSALVLLGFAVPLASVAVFIGWDLRHSPETRALAAMQGVYVIQISFWLMSAAGDFDAGAWLGVLAVASYLIQLALFAKRAVRAAALLAGVIVPLAALYLAQS